jgi:ADP-ribose pyrophosphatase YjhB (NUDIX family)
MYESSTSTSTSASTTTSNKNETSFLLDPVIGIGTNEDQFFVGGSYFEALHDSAQTHSLYYGGMISKNNICNNCGKNGHSFHQCNLPITSYGIILCNRATETVARENKFLMIRRKDSYGYVEFARGKYSLNNLGQMQTIVDEMSVPEKRKILEFTQYKNDDSISRKKMDALKSGITVNNESVTLESLIKNSGTAWDETEWEFPKGRRNHNEKDIDCALREFAEETGYSLKDIHLIDNLQPFEETFIGSNYKAYKHKYYLAILSETANPGFLQNYQVSEVSELKWMTCEECVHAIRPYSFEKIALIQNVQHLLNEYEVF